MKRLNLKHSLGFSLLEMFVAMIVGLFIIMGISSVYVGNKRTSLTSNELSQLQENGRSVLQLLTEVIQHTAYTSTSVAPAEDMFIRGPVSTAVCSDGTDSVLNTALFSALENNTATGDTIGVVYLGDNTLNQDCAAETLPRGCQLGGEASVQASRIYNYFSVVRGEDDMPSLMCAGSRSRSAQVIAEGVENIQFTYGEDLNSDGTADRYVNADDVASWGAVVSINIAALIRSAAPVAAVTARKSYRLSEDTIVRTNDKYLRAVFTSTVRLRNAI